MKRVTNLVFTEYTVFVTEEEVLDEYFDLALGVRSERTSRGWDGGM